MRYFGIGADVSNLRRRFDFMLIAEDETYPNADKLELRGKHRHVKKRLEVLEMWIDRTAHVPSAVRVVQTDGDVTLWEFTDMLMNPELPPDTYILNIGPKTSVHSGDKTLSSTVNLLDGILDEEEPEPKSGSGQ